MRAQVFPARLQGMTSAATFQATDWGVKWLEWRHAVRPANEVGVLDAIGRLAVMSASTEYVWRGVRDASHGVQPSVFRVPGMAGRGEDEVAAFEERLLKEAVSWRVGHGVETFPTYLSALATIQHHSSRTSRIGTRLLDVSTEPLTALWFATASHESASGSPVDGVVFGFKSQDLVHFGTHSDQRGFRDPGTGLEGGLGPLFKRASDRPFVVIPEFPSPRMLAQNALFLASRAPGPQRRNGLLSLGIDGLDLGFPPSRVNELSEPNYSYLCGTAGQHAGHPQKPLFVAIVVRGSLKARLRTMLATTYGRSARTIYPDVQGFVDNWSGV